METKEILGIIAAIIIVIIVIGVLSMVQGNRSKNPAESLPDQQPAVEAPTVTGTSIWDQIHAAQETASAEDTSESGTGEVQTGEDGSVLTAESGETTETTTVDEPKKTIPPDPFAPPPAETEPEEIAPIITQAPADDSPVQNATMIVVRP